LDPASLHSLAYVLVASALLVLGAVALTLAALYPITAMGVIALAGAGWYVVRTFRRFYRTRRRAGWTREVCVPKTGVCVEL
jgi:positive regulator of sigma E activity